MQALTPVVDLTPDDIETFEHELKQSSRYKPVELKAELTGQRAAALIEDPHDGSVLAMVSAPSYDLNPFVKGISYKACKKLLQDKKLPLINRVTQGLYPPASTVKPFMAMSAPK